MGTGLGIKGIMGLAKQAAYITGVDATDKVPFLSESMELQNENLMHEYLYGGAATPDTQRVFQPAGGSIECVIPYTQKSGAAYVSSTLLIALAMGGAAWHAGSSSNLISFVDDLDVSGTMAFDKGMSSTNTWEFIGCMINSLTIAGNAGEFVTLSVESQASQFAFSGPTGNTPTELQALPTDLPVLVMFSDLTFRIGDQAGALASTDNCAISSFSLVCNNNLTDAQQATPDDTNCLDYAHTDPLAPIKPARNGFRETTLEITIPRYEGDEYLTFESAETRLQASLSFADPSGTGYLFNIFLPHLKILKVSAPVQGPEAIEQTVSFRVLKINADSDVTFTGGTAITGEMGIETKDERDAVITNF